MKKKIFISSVQKEFAKERRILKDFILGDALLHSFFVEYDIPQPVVAEAIVNAIAHRDYVSSASVQIMLFTDRLEVWNPGILPPLFTLASLKNRDLSSKEMRELLCIKHRPTFRQNYLHPALTKKLIEPTIPKKPNSRLQKYRLTKKGLDHAKGN